MTKDPTNSPPNDNAMHRSREAGRFQMDDRRGRNFGLNLKTARRTESTLQWPERDLSLPTTFWSEYLAGK